MTDIEDKKGWKLWRFQRPDCDAAWLEHGYVEAEPKRVAETAAREFRALNPKTKWKFTAATLAKAAKASDKQLRKLNAELHAADTLETVISNEWIAKPHWAVRAGGLFVGALGVALLLPLPMIIGAGVSESLLIDKALENPLWALAYGFAPFGAVLATHGLRDALKTDTTRRRFDITVYLSTLAAFGVYAWNFGPTFLVDVLLDPSAAAEAGSLADFYGYHLVLEILGASSAWCAAMHMLTFGAKRVSRKTEAAELLETAIEEETQRSIAIARQRDLVATTPDTYSSAQSAYQDHAMLKRDLAAKLLAAQSAHEGVELLKQLLAALTTPEKGTTDV